MKGFTISECVSATAKSIFPGHGDTSTISSSLPYLTFLKSDYTIIELYPYKKLIQNGLASIMVAHLDVPAFEPQKGVPTSLSYNTITKILKEDLEFEGLIFTDALNMKAASTYKGAGEVDLAAFLAAVINKTNVYGGGIRKESALDTRSKIAYVRWDDVPISPFVDELKKYAKCDVFFYNSRMIRTILDAYDHVLLGFHKADGAGKSTILQTIELKFITETIAQKHKYATISSVYKTVCFDVPLPFFDDLKKA
ncbi:hypothetical protein FQR65_LT19585 [Abscondita terminalis]|nr:hypothetical protein FQR65_LT19585 [Abscondita terminalis]